MTRLLRFGPVLSACLSLGACAQLIGLDKFDDKGGADEAGKAGSAGKGGSGGSGGHAQGGTSGGPGTGGSTSGKGGGGTVGGAAGESGAGPKGGKGGTGGSTNPGGAGGMEEGGAGGVETGGTGGTGGSVGNAGAGAGGESNGCSTTIEIVTHGIPDTYDETMVDPPTVPNYQYVYNIDPQIGSFAIDYLNIVFYHNTNQYNGDLTGTFELGQGDEENYATCARCVYIDQDYGSSGAAVNYFAASGTMAVAPTSRQMSGHPDVEFTDVLFKEATIDFGNTDVSTYVPNGRCLHLASAHLTVTVPTGWTCSPSSYGGGDDCDCGCGIKDPDCTSSAVGACVYCDDSGSCASDCSDITLGNNATCTANQSWTCDPLSYGDGQTCDCGCGIVDIDCPSAAAADCGGCSDPNSCTAALSGACSDIDSLDNSKCN